MTIELVADIIDRTPMLVIAVLCHRENLIVALYSQFQLRFKVLFDKHEGFTQDLFAGDFQESEASVIFTSVYLSDVIFCHSFLFFLLRPRPPDERGAGRVKQMVGLSEGNAVRGYAVAGIKQRREPMRAYAAEGTLFERAETRPALAPVFAAPPNSTPIKVVVDGIDVQ